MSLIDELTPIEIAEPITHETSLDQLLPRYPEWEDGTTVSDSVMSEFLSPTSQAEYRISGRAYAVKPILTSATAKQNYLYVQSLTVLAMNGDYYTRRRGGDSHMLLYTLSGSGRFEYEGRTALLRPGDGVWIDCAHEHRYQTIGDEWTHVVLHFCGTSAGAWHDEYASRHPFRFHKDAGSEFQDRLEQLVRDYGSISYGRDVKIANGISGLLTMLIVDEEFDDGTQGGVLDDAQRVIGFLEQHLSEPITLDRLASLVHVSKFHLSHAFKQATGYSPIDYLIDLRMNQARLLLATTKLPVARVAEAVGLPNSQYFGKLFKRRMGVTPGAYRRAARS